MNGESQKQDTWEVNTPLLKIHFFTQIRFTPIQFFTLKLILALKLPLTAANSLFSCYASFLALVCRDNKKVYASRKVRNDTHTEASTPS